MKVDIEQYDFLDFGASTGGSMKFAMESLGGHKGLGIDISPQKVNSSVSLGFDCIEADATMLEFPDDCVEFVVISHLIEHLPNLHVVEKLIKSAVRVASSFVFIQGPYFDANEYLSGMGLKYFYADWTGHTCHFKISALSGMLEKLELNEYKLAVTGITKDSSDPFVHPLQSPPNQQKYDDNLHPPKPLILFQQPVYKEFICIIKTGKCDNFEQLIFSKPKAALVKSVLLPEMVNSHV